MGSASIVRELERERITREGRVRCNAGSWISERGGMEPGLKVKPAREGGRVWWRKGKANLLALHVPSGPLEKEDRVSLRERVCFFPRAAAAAAATAAGEREDPDLPPRDFPLPPAAPFPVFLGRREAAARRAGVRADPNTQKMRL